MSLAEITNSMMAHQLGSVADSSDRSERVITDKVKYYYRIECKLIAL